MLKKVVIIILITAITMPVHAEKFSGYWCQLNDSYYKTPSDRPGKPNLPYDKEAFDANLTIGKKQTTYTCQPFTVEEKGKEKDWQLLPGGTLLIAKVPQAKPASIASKEFMGTAFITQKISATGGSFEIQPRSIIRGKMTSNGFAFMLPK